jgi:Holliday junction resolvasome RuvABC endonuclease subunit
MIKLCGIDPGFASIGHCLVELKDDGTPTVLKLGLIETEKSSKKQNVLASNDNFRRAREISKALREVFKTYQPVAVCTEAMSFPRSSSVAAKVAMTWGVLADICEDQGYPMLMATPKEVKKAVGVAAGTSKEAVWEALHARFGTGLADMLDEAGIPKSKREHPYDSLGSVLSCLNAEATRLLLAASRSGAADGQGH